MANNLTVSPRLLKSLDSSLIGQVDQGGICVVAFGPPAREDPCQERILRIAALPYAQMWVLAVWRSRFFSAVLSANRHPRQGRNCCSRLGEVGIGQNRGGLNPLSVARD